MTVFSTDYINDLHAAKRRAWEAMKEIGDRAEAHDSLSAEDREAFDRAETDYQSYDKELNRALRANQIGDLPDLAPEAVRAVSDVQVEATRVKGLVEMRDGEVIEFRETTTGDTGAPVPTSFYDRLIEHLIYAGPMLETSTVITTSGGENLQIPRTSAWSTAAIFAEATAITESDPTFQAFVTLGAFKYSVLVNVSNEMLSDSGVDIDQYVARQAGLAIGTAVNAGLTVGTGTVEPWGLFERAAAGATATDTATAGGFDYDDLIDLYYSVNAAYRRIGGGWQLDDTAAAQARKLKDDAGNYIWNPAAQFGEPDRLLGAPVFENPDAPAMASAADVVAFGDLSQYHVRQVGGISVARSTDFKFSEDITSYRVTWRGDGDLPQTASVKKLVGGDGS